MLGFGQKEKFEILNVKTVEDMQKYLQSLDDKFIQQHNEITKNIESFKNMINTFENSFNERVEKIDSLLGKVEFVSKSKIKVIETQLLNITNNTKSLTTLENDIKQLFIDEMKPMKEYAFEQRDKLKRYESGYDSKILDKFFKSIFKILDIIKKENSVVKNELVEDIKDDLLIILKNSSIYKLDIQEGDTYDANKYDQYVDITYINTSNEKEAGVIKEVKRDAYYLLSGEYKKPKHSAKIHVYKFNKKEGE